VVAQGFWFANGVTLSSDESFAAVVETNTQSVHRVWLSGPKVPAPRAAFCTLRCSELSVTSD
jgi:sugar lactone lactonase YvrE